MGRNDKNKKEKKDDGNIPLTAQPSNMTFGLNLLEDAACISIPLLALIIIDLLKDWSFWSLHASESLQLYLILCLARSLNRRRNSNWPGSLVYSIYKENELMM